MESLVFFPLPRSKSQESKSKTHRLSKVQNSKSVGLDD